MSTPVTRETMTAFGKSCCWRRLSLLSTRLLEASASLPHVSYLNKAYSCVDNKLDEIPETVPFIQQQQQMEGFLCASQDLLQWIGQRPGDRGPRVLCWWQGGKQIKKGSGRRERNAPGAGGKQRRKQACPASCGRRTALLRGGDTWAEFWRVSRSLPGRERGRRCRQQEAAGAETRAACERAWQEMEGEAGCCRSWRRGWVSGLRRRWGFCKGSLEPDAEGCEHRRKQPDLFIYFRRVATTLINI